MNNLNDNPEISEDLKAVLTENKNESVIDQMSEPIMETEKVISKMKSKVENTTELPEHLQPLELTKEQSYAKMVSLAMYNQAILFQEAYQGTEHEAYRRNLVLPAAMNEGGYNHKQALKDPGYSSNHDLRVIADRLRKNLILFMTHKANHLPADFHKDFTNLSMMIGEFAKRMLLIKEPGKVLFLLDAYIGGEFDEFLAKLEADRKSVETPEAENKVTEQAEEERPFTS